MKSKKAQMEVTFNWVYVLIAGTVILLFFAGIVMKQKDVAEKNLASDLLRVMQSIFTGAGVSEKTKNIIDLSGLAEYTFYFDCNEGISQFGIKDQSSKITNAFQPLFSPREIKSPELITWSLPYQLPYKVTDLLMVTSMNTEYFLLGDDVYFTSELGNVSREFNLGHIYGIEDYNLIDPGDNYQVRVVDFNLGIVREGGLIPDKLISLDDDKVTAVVFSGVNQADFFQKQANKWKKLNRNPIRIISLGGERDAAKYAAIFAGDDQIYQCNMQKAFKRLSFVTEVYAGETIKDGREGGKLKELIDYYENNYMGSSNTKASCLGNLRDYGENGMRNALMQYYNKVKMCVSTVSVSASECFDLVSLAGKVRDVNENLKRDCVTLY